MDFNEGGYTNYLHTNQSVLESETEPVEYSVR